MGKRKASKASDGAGPLRLDLGCGGNKREGFLGVDVEARPGVDVVHDLTTRWPWEDGSVEEVVSSHFLEHIPGPLRLPMMDELWRVLKPGARALFVVPYWASKRAVQDPTHAWPPICEDSLLYFNKGWREANKLFPSTLCDFDWSYEYLLNGALAAGRSEEYVRAAVATQVNIVADLRFTLVKRLV